MANLPRFTLTKDREQDDWVLKSDVTGRVRRRFDTKADATAGGVLGEALGSGGGSVRIERERGGYDEERTYPRSKDPRRSKG